MITLEKLLTMAGVFAGLLLAAGFGYVFLARAAYLVSLEARFYRNQLRARSKLSDQEIDRRASPVWFVFMIDSMSHFVNRGPEHPEEFPRLLVYFRLIGCSLISLIVLVILLLAWAASTGRLTIGTTGG